MHGFTPPKHPSTQDKDATKRVNECLFHPFLDLMMFPFDELSGVGPCHCFRLYEGMNTRKVSPELQSNTF